MTFATAPSSWSGGRWPRARTGSFLRRRWEVVAEPGIRTSRAPAGRHAAKNCRACRQSEHGCTRRHGTEPDGTWVV